MSRLASGVRRNNTFASVIGSLMEMLPKRTVPIKYSTPGGRPGAVTMIRKHPRRRIPQLRFSAVHVPAQLPPLHEPEPAPADSRPEPTALLSPWLTRTITEPSPLTLPEISKPALPPFISVPELVAVAAVGHDHHAPLTVKARLLLTRCGTGAAERDRGETGNGRQADEAGSVHENPLSGLGQIVLGSIGRSPCLFRDSRKRFMQGHRNSNAGGLKIGGKIIATLISSLKSRPPTDCVY
jgi:hypothetical protein